MFQTQQGTRTAVHGTHILIVNGQHLTIYAHRDKLNSSDPHIGLEVTFELRIVPDVRSRWLRMCGGSKPALGFARKLSIGPCVLVFESRKLPQARHNSLPPFHRTSHASIGVRGQSEP